MAKSQVLYLSGKAKWCKLFEPDEYRNVKAWKLDFYPDPASMDKLKAAKVQKKIKENEDGLFISLSRKVMKPWEVREGENPEFDPPRIINADGDDWDKNKLIGNGSSVTLGVEVYQTKMGPGTRLDVVRVDHLIEYSKEDMGMPEAVHIEVEPSPDKQAKTTIKPIDTKFGKADLNDKIPF